MTANRARSPWRAAAAAACAGLAASLLAGCISLLPKTKPVQLYRFGADEAVGAAPVARSSASFAVRTTPSDFTRASATDRILTVTGVETAYIANARWVTSAGTLFDAAVVRAFDAHGGPARLLARGEAAPADYSLKIDVRTFEVRYDGGRGSAPTVAVELYAALDNGKDPSLARERIFQAKIAAAQDDAGAIAAAFGRAVDDVTTALVAWVDAKGA